MSNFTRLFAGLICFVFKCESVLITKMVVPSHVEQGSDVTLRCENNLNDDFSLYSIKWYKDYQEFFGCTHQENSTRFNVFSQSNFTIQYSEREKGAAVHLKEVTREAEGRYMCVIMVGAPLFYIDYREENLTIYDISSLGPLLIGHPKNNLKNGNQLRYTCSFRKSKPKPILSWFVDNQEIAGELEFRYLLTLAPPMDMRCCGSTLEWWSIESSLSIWPSPTQVEEGICVVSCRIIVLNETIYQRVSSMSTTSDTFHKMAANKSLNSKISTLQKGIVVRDSRNFPRVEVFFLFIFGFVAALIALHGLVFQPLFLHE